VAVRYVDVTEPEQMQLEVTRLVSVGFVVANQTNRSVMLVKRKQFSMAMLIIGLFLCFIPLFIYLLVYAFQSDQVVEIRLVERPRQVGYRPSEHMGLEGPPPGAPQIQMSPDGQAWWDGTAWVSLQTAIPHHAARHPDGTRWWDGQAWRPIRGGE
jgi:hypothetical protein